MLVLRAQIAALLLLLVSTTELAASDAVPTDVWCGSDYWFTLDKPHEWRADSAEIGDKRILNLVPPGHTPDDAAVQIDISFARSADPKATDVRLDIAEELERWVSDLRIFGEPMSVQTFAADNPRLPAVGRVLIFEPGTLYVVALDAASGRGNTFSVSLSKRGGSATARELELLQRIVASIDFNPLRGCMSDGKGIRAPTALRGHGSVASEYDSERPGLGDATPGS